MRFGVIYKATCLTTGKAYIGRTVKENPFLRIMEHKRNIERHPHIFFYRALKKYGWNDFQWEVLCHEIPEDQLPKMEEFLIVLHDTFDNGYNSTKGGEANPMDNPETRTKTSQTLKSKNIHLSLEQRQAISERQMGEKNHMFGRSPSEETRKKISAAGMGRYHTDESKKKIRMAHLGKPKSAEHRKKISETHKGMKISDEIRNKISDSGSKYLYQVIDPDEKVFEVKSLNRFCIENGLDASRAFKVVLGKAKHHKGYKFVRLGLISELEKS